MSSKIYNNIMKIFFLFFFPPEGAEGVIDVERCFVCMFGKIKKKKMKKVSAVC